jgi:hypothetical protein
MVGLYLPSHPRGMPPPLSCLPIAGNSQSWTAGGIDVVGFTVTGLLLELPPCRAFDAGEPVYWCGNASNGGTLKP